jgi:MFS family permease
MSRDKLILFVGLITYGMGQSLLFVIFAPLARDLGLAEWQLGLIVAASNMALALSAPLWGTASQRLGRRPVYLTGLTGYAVGYAALAFAIQAGLWGWIAALPLFGLLLLLRLAYGAFVGGINPAAMAYIADTTDEKARGQGMAFIAMTGGLGTIIGPAFGGGLTFIAGVWAWLALEEPARRAGAGPARKLRLTDPRILPYLVGWLVVFGVFTGIQTITVYFIADRYGISDTTATQRAMMVAMLAMAFVTVFVQAVVLQRWKATPGTMLKTGFGILALALLVLVLGPGLGSLYLGYGLFGLSFGFTAPGLNAAGSLSVEPEEQGAVAGLLSAAPTVGMIFGPILCGLVYRWAPSLPMTTGIILALLMMVWLMFVRVPDPRPQA